MPTLEEISANFDKEFAAVNLKTIAITKRMQDMALDFSNLNREITELNDAVAKTLSNKEALKAEIAAMMAAQGADQAAIDAAASAIDTAVKPIEEAAAPSPIDPPAEPA
jgi:peptidoglycan hydrolase CwlO-like protein